MVDVAQLVRASVCGTEGREFESRLLPSNFFKLGVMAEWSKTHAWKACIQ